MKKEMKIKGGQGRKPDALAFDAFVLGVAGLTIVLVFLSATAALDLSACRCIMAALAGGLLGAGIIFVRKVWK